MKKWVIIGIIGLVIIILGIIGYFYFTQDKESDITDEQEVLMEGEEWFQTENTQAITQLQLKQSLELENNKLGEMITLHPRVHTEDPDDLANRFNEAGLKWLRLSIDTFDWNEVPAIEGYSEYKVYPEQDRAITALSEKEINVMHTLVFWDDQSPSFQDNSEYKEDYSRFRTQDEIQRYLDYVQFIVSHFKGKIEYYEILNEPNAREGTQQYVKADDYITVAEQTISIIRQEDPDAKIVVGSITPLYETKDKEYFFTILRSNIMPLVDGVSFHGIGPKTSPEYDVDDYYGYPALLQEIKDTASSYGFTGEYISEEIHYRTSDTYHPHEPWLHTNIAAAKYLARGIIIQLGMDFTTGIAASNEGQMIITQNLATIMAGAEPTDLSIEIQSQATNIEYYTFSLSNGDKLIALWTDGTAVENDLGVSADLIITGISSQEVIAIDVLNGYTQALTIEENTIKDLIVRDYPLIIQITSNS